VEILDSEGGCYFDMDTLFVGRVPDELLEGECVLGKDATGNVSNAVMLACKGSSFIKAYGNHQKVNFDGSWLAHSSGLLNKLVPFFNGSRLRVEVPERFYPFLWDEKGLRALFRENERVGSDTVSIHLWEHMWCKAPLKDRLTEGYIKGVDTTYNCLAREYL
jgi:hypothetical protein